MSESCAFCGHKHLSAKTTRYFHEQGDEILIVNAVPCLECDYCGEQYFDAAVLKYIEAEHFAILQQGKTPQSVRQVAIEEFGMISA